MKVKKSDYKAAGSLLQKDHIEKTGLANSEVDMVEVVFNPYADRVTCPACSTQFKPTVAICPECGLQFG